MAHMMGDIETLERLKGPRIHVSIPTSITERLQQKLKSIAKRLRPDLAKPGERSAEGTAKDRRRDNLFG